MAKGNKKGGKGKGAGQTEGSEPAGDAAGEVTGEAGEAVATPGRRGRGETLKNFVGTRGPNGEVNYFSLTDSDSISQFVAQFGDMGRNWVEAGYDTHVNDGGPMTRKGVEKRSNQGVVKAMAVYADVLASRAALAGTADHGLRDKASPDEALSLLTAFYNFVGGLLEAKRAEVQERNLEAAAKVAGVTVEALKALRAQNPS